jgi:hypothetical protein
MKTLLENWNKFLNEEEEQAVDAAEAMPAYAGTVADARAIGFGNIKYSEN